MENPISKDIIEKWLKAWCLSRKLPLPVNYKSGFKVNVGFEQQKCRYVFSELNEDFIQLAKEINEPWIYLKVCDFPKKIEKNISDIWEIQPQGYMMHCHHPMKIPKTQLNENYKLEFESYNSTSVIKIVTKNNELVACEGRVVIIDDLAIYDRIITDNNHRRQGLATFLMKELENIALANGIFKNFLVATEEGKLLYENLGWELYSLYTSIVIKNKTL